MKYFLFLSLLLVIGGLFDRYECRRAEASCSISQVYTITPIIVTPVMVPSIPIVVYTARKAGLFYDFTVLESVHMQAIKIDTNMALVQDKGKSKWYVDKKNKAINTSSNSSSKKIGEKNMRNENKKEKDDNLKEMLMRCNSLHNDITHTKSYSRFSKTKKDCLPKGLTLIKNASLTK